MSLEDFAGSGFAAGESDEKKARGSELASNTIQALKYWTAFLARVKAIMKKVSFNGENRINRPFRSALRFQKV
jgi:hypothetical protein